jgi:inner membrane protein
MQVLQFVFGRMMNANAHMVIGFACGLALTHNMPHPVMLFVATGAGLSALLPDVDHANSRINRLLIVTVLFSFLFKHRGFTHSLLALGIVWFGGQLFIPPALIVPIAIGWGSHIIADAITPAGVPLLYPLTAWRFKSGIGIITVGGLIIAYMLR